MYNDYDFLIGSLGVASIFAMTLLVMFAIVIINYLFTVYPIYKMSKKANLKNTNFAFVPILNGINVYNLANLSFWYCLIIFIPWIGAIASMILAAYIHFKLAENFGLNTLGCIAAIFFPLIVYWYIALSDKNFVGTIDKKYINEEPVILNTDKF